MKLYHAPRTRSVRIYWLLEELGVPYELEVVPFTPPPSGTGGSSSAAGTVVSGGGRWTVMVRLRP